MNLNSIHQDNRGQIFIITGEELGHPEMTMFHTKKGFARGGCVHNLSDEFICVVKGMIEYVMGGDYMTLQDGDSMVVPKGMPHYFYSITDSVVMEWGATPEEKKHKHPEYRQRVDKINDSAS